MVPTGTFKCCAVPRAVVLTKHGCVPRAVLVAEVTRKSGHHPVCVAKICLVGVLRWRVGISTAYWRESEILKKGGLIMHVQNKPLDSTQDKHSHWLYLTHVSCLISYEHTPVGTRSRSGLLDTSGRNLQTKCHVLDYIRM